MDISLLLQLIIHSPLVHYLIHYEMTTLMCLCQIMDYVTNQRRVDDELWLQ